MDLTLLSADNWTPYFACRRIDPDEHCDMLKNVYALRYQVYCLECGFLPAEDYPESLEVDEYDQTSTHFCASNHDGDIVGYVRLVQAGKIGHLPFEEHCTQIFDNVTLPPIEESAEISRLMVRRDYRRRKGDTLAGVNIETVSLDKPVPERRQNNPQIVLGLYRQMYQHSIDIGIRYWYAAMERSLARALMRFNFAFVPIGLETDYYGPVAPYLADLRELESRLAEHNPQLLAWFQQTTV